HAGPSENPIHASAAHCKALKTVLQSKLQNPWRPLDGRNAPESPQIQVGGRDAPVEVVEQVERLEPQLHRLRAGEVDVARQRQVENATRSARLPNCGVT